MIYLHRRWQLSEKLNTPEDALSILLTCLTFANPQRWEVTGVHPLGLLLLHWMLSAARRSSELCVRVVGARAQVKVQPTTET